MPENATILHPSKRPAAAALLVLGVMVLWGAGSGYFYVFAPQKFEAAIVIGAAVVLSIVLLGWKYTKQRHARQNTALMLGNIITNETHPVFITDHNLGLVAQNDAADIAFPVVQPKSIVDVFKFTFADPVPVLDILIDKALTQGKTHLDLSTENRKYRLFAQVIDPHFLYWRCERLIDPNTTSVTAAMSEPHLPMLSASKTGTVLYMNQALRQLLGARVKTLDRIFTDLPLKNGQEHQITTANGPHKMLVAEITGASGRREIYLLPRQLGLDASICGQVFEGLPVPMLKMDAKGKVIEANRLARGMLGTQACCGCYLGDLVQGLGRSVADWLNDAVDGRGLHRPQVLRARKPEKDVFVQITLSLEHEKNTPVLVAVLTDATELKTLEAQFVQSQKMQAIGQLAGGIAHDFNNLLTAISGHCDLLMLRHDLGDPDYSDLIQINQNATRAASLVGQLLAFSRKQNLQPEMIDLRDTMSEMTHLLNRLVGEPIALTLSHDPDLKSIRADKRQFEQVLMNLVVNARDAMPDGGDIRIVTQNLTLKDELKRDRAVIPAGDYVVISVFDQGVGIDADKIEKIFEPFYTTKKVGEGTGLGLSTVYGIVKQSGGYVFVNNNSGKGVCFSIYLPAYLPSVTANEPVETPMVSTDGMHGEGVILLVEDEAPVRAFASRALRMRGYTVLEAENAEVALETLEDQDLKIDIFVTDVIMPGLDGPTWVKRAIKTRPDVKVVFVSGYAEDDFSDHQSKIPNSVFLAKPFSLKELTNTVQKQLH